MKKLIILLLIIFTSFNLFSKDQEILPLESKAYDYIDYLYLLNSKVPPTAAKPYSISQMKVYLNSLNYNNLNKTSIKYYNYLTKLIEKESLDIKLDDLSSIDVEGNTGFEVYTHNNTTDIKTNRDWTYLQEDRIPLLKLKLNIALDKIFFTTCELQYQQGKYEPSKDSIYYLKNNDFIDNYAPYGIGTLASTDIIYNILTNQYNQKYSTNIPLASKFIDFDTPKRAFLSVGGKNWNLNFSKDTIEWGNSIIGNFIFDNHFNNNFLNLKFYSKKFNINNTIAFLNTQTNNGESPDTEIKMFMTHRLEFRPFEKFRFAISENVMYQNNIPIFLYFNPSNIYHNINMREMFNAIAHFESDIYISNNKSWYSQFVLDQARAPNENASQSAAWGFSTGLRKTSIINKNILILTTEALIATPCLYRRDEVDFISFNRTFVINQSYVIEPTFIGFQEGGDSLAFKIQVQYNNLDKFNFLIYYYLLFKGEVDIFTATHVDENGNPISNDDKPNYGEMLFKNGIYSLKHVIYSALDYQIYSDKNISISNKITFSYIYKLRLKPSASSYDDIQLSSGISIKF